MFVKIHEQIFSSSIMEEDLEVRYIWFCLLTLADKEGFIDMTIPAIARRINLDDEIVSKAIDKFMKPDPTSRTHTQDGKRLEKIRDSFGWKIINYIYYRDLRSEENRREYMRDYMRKQRDVSKKVNTNVNSKQCKHPLAHTDTDTDTDTDPFKRVVQEFEKIWLKYPRRHGKKAALKHYKASIKTKKDFLDIQIALNNYLISDTVKKGFIQNGSTWFNNWRDWVEIPTTQIIRNPQEIKQDQNIKTIQNWISKKMEDE